MFQFFHTVWFNESILKTHGICISRFLSCNIEHSANEGKNNESLHDRILISSWLDAVLGKDIEGNLSYSVVAPLEEQVPGHNPRLSDGVPGEDLILVPAQTVTCFSSSHEEVLAKADSFQAWLSSRKKAGLLPSSGIGVVKHLLKICFPCIANLSHNHFCPKMSFDQKPPCCSTSTAILPLTVLQWQSASEKEHVREKLQQRRRITLDPCTLSV